MNIQKKLLTFMRKKIQIKHEKTDYKFFKKIIVLVLRKSMYTPIPNNISRIDMFIKS